MKYNRVLHYRDGRSDKVYIVSVRKNTNGDFSVVCKWGRRGYISGYQVKGTHPTEQFAIGVMNNIAQKQINQGYADVELPIYQGAVTLGSVSGFLEADETFKGLSTNSPIPDVEVPTQKEDEVLPAFIKTVKPRGFVNAMVRCIRDNGVEHELSMGQEYMTEKHTEPDMVWVLFPDGSRNEYFQDRFERVNK